MPTKNNDLHGNSPDSCRVVLLLVDVINDLEFPGGEELLPHALQAAANIALLKARAKAAGIPVVYANDNFGRWRSDFNAVVSHCLEESVRGRPLVELLLPDDEDYFVLKPKHSAFYATTLETLLAYLGADTLIIAGFSGDICVLLTASDAYLRDFHLFVPADCSASLDPEENGRSMAYIQRVLRADIRASTDLDLRHLVTLARSPEKPMCLPGEAGERSR